MLPDPLTKQRGGGSWLPPRLFKAASRSRSPEGPVGPTAPAPGIIRRGGARLTTGLTPIASHCLRSFRIQSAADCTRHLATPDQTFLPDPESPISTSHYSSRSTFERRAASNSGRSFLIS